MNNAYARGETKVSPQPTAYAMGYRSGAAHSRSYAMKNYYKCAHVEFRRSEPSGERQAKIRLTMESLNARFCALQATSKASGATSARVHREPSLCVREMVREGLQDPSLTNQKFDDKIKSGIMKQVYFYAEAPKHKQDDNMIHFNMIFLLNKFIKIIENKVVDKLYIFT